MNRSLLPASDFVRRRLRRVRAEGSGDGLGHLGLEFPRGDGRQEAHVLFADLLFQARVVDVGALLADLAALFESISGVR